jgi:GNAT superfamily N-acetyltransferase
MVTVTVRELSTDEFPLVEALWVHYHGQKTDRTIDRIVGAFVDGDLAAVARCRRHPDGLEVDGVFASEEHRGQGLARLVMEKLLSIVGDHLLYLHSTLVLTRFYGSLGFVTIPESDLPPTIKERLAFCFGEMKGCGVAPMRRNP